MSKSYRVLTELGADKSVQIQIDQDFDFLEILSLKITQSEIYARMCADYGVIVGRVIANNGYGIPNARVSVFIPLTQEDDNNPVISTLYPYKTLTDKNEDGYRYNLLPYIQSYSNHTPTGTFPSRDDVLTNTAIIEVYDKYYKYTAKTNDSGDFMIFGVPVGSQVIVMDLDLSDIGQFSLSPQDLIRMGIATENQVDGLKFRSSTNLDSLPQLININKEVEVLPFWGQPEVCQFAITREDFDLVREANLDIQPNAIFMGSLISTIDRDVVKPNCKPKLRSGQLCRLNTGPGEILAIRQTIFNDSSGLPILEQYVLESGGKVIDDNGTWLIDLPMNMNYVYTDQFGNQVISNDPKIGIPTKAKYRFKIKWQQSPEVTEDIKRGYFLVPNIREYGWSSSSIDPLSVNPNDPNVQKSYAFSLDWNDYVDPQSAINCEDTFYEFKYNKVYTVSQLITQYRKGKWGSRFIGIKNILDDVCESENNPFPTNDANFRYDILFLLFMVLVNILKPVLYVLLIIAHLLKYLIWIILFPIISSILSNAYGLISAGVAMVASGFPSAGAIIGGGLLIVLGAVLIGIGVWLIIQAVKLTQKDFTINLPMLSYPDCELCSCQLDTPAGSTLTGSAPVAPKFPPASSFLYPFQFPYTYLGHIDDENTKVLWWGHMHAGMNGIATDSIPNVGSLERTPGYFNGNWSRDRGFITTSLPIPELINLFNLKAKYFNNDNNDSPAPVVNAGQQTSNGGWNQIKVAVNPTANGGSNASPFSGLHHYDKPLVIVTVGGVEFVSGTMLTFQDPKLTKDKNVTGGTYNDTFGLNTITGTVINQNTYSITYANPTDQYAASAIGPITYSIIQQSGETVDNLNSGILYHKFPTDLEYYQVITGMTYSSFYSQFNSSFPPYSFLGRIEGDRLLYETSQRSNSTCLINELYVDKPLTGATDLNNAVVYILFRGVDPYSTRQPTHVDLSRIFGYDYGFGPVIFNNFKLNWPIQPSLKLPNHYNQTDNTDSPGQAGDTGTTANLNRYFFPSLSYQVGVTTGGTPLWSAYTTNMHGYYSNCDSSYFTTTPLSTALIPTTIPPVINGFSVGGPNATTGPDNELRIHPNNLYCYYLPRQDRQGSIGHYSFCALNTSGFSGAVSSFYLRNNCRIFLPNNLPALSLTTQSYWALNLFPVVGTDPLADRIYYSQDTGYEATIFGPSIDNRNFGGKGKGYWSDSTLNLGEYLEGGSVMTGRLHYSYNGSCGSNFPTSFRSNITPNELRADYHSFIYGSGMTLAMSSQTYIVMRSERLPSSTNVEESSEKYSVGSNYRNSYVLHQNTLFEAFEISDDGAVSSFNVNSGGFSFQESEGSSTANTIDRSLDSFSCGNMYPLECYTYNSFNQTIQVGPGSPNYPDCIKYNDKDIFIQGSCYRLVTTNIVSLVKDIKLLTEYISRMIINFGACRDVWSHLFVNNWVNGVLYAFAFRNDSIYSGLTTTNPQLKYCKDVMIFHQSTNNFYYRSSPYKPSTIPGTTGDFIGKNAPPSGDLPTRGPGNKRNLLYPTTILDMGPRNDYLNQLNYNIDYDGYYLDKMKSTSFGDVSEILNYLILSRMISTKFLAQLFSSQGANIFSYFTRYGRLLPRNMVVDADYAQLISINSEIGVSSFEPENYPDPPTGRPPVYFNGGNSVDAVIGIFYFSDTQLRDYVTPRRKLINPFDPVPSLGAFSTTNDFYFIGTNSQVVPFYKWEINFTTANDGGIFGSQRNDWYTSPIGTSYFKYKYQEVDRLVYPTNAPPPFPEQYMMSQNSSRMDYFKGYIYAVDNGGVTADISPSPSDIFIPASNAVLVGAPYHFYFGLKQGKSAFNRFVTKWVKPEVVT